jgi:hypothetical protein
MLFAVELVVFGFIGWSWLAFREMMSETPVLDVTVLITNLIVSGLNIALALIFSNIESFTSCAQAHFSHSFAQWLLYIYSFSQSVNGGWEPLCCTQGDTKASLARTYVAAYFGSVRFNEIAAPLTLAFLTIILLISAGQVRACQPEPFHWMVRSSGAAVACLISIHLLLFVSHAHLCQRWNVYELIVLITAGGAFLGMIDLGWIWSGIRGEQNQWWSRMDRFVGVFIEFMLLVALSILTVILNGLIAKGISWTILICLGLPVTGTLFLILREAAELYDTSAQAGQGEEDEEEEEEEDDGDNDEEEGANKEGLGKRFGWFNRFNKFRLNQNYLGSQAKIQRTLNFNGVNMRSLNNPRGQPVTKQKGRPMGESNPYYQSRYHTSAVPHRRYHSPPPFPPPFIPLQPKTLQAADGGNSWYGGNSLYGGRGGAVQGKKSW